MSAAARPLDILLVSWDGGGNVPPMVALGKRLVARGHRTTVLGTPSLEVRVEAAGLGFRPFAHARSWAPCPGVAIEDDLISLALHLVGPEIGADLTDTVEASSPDVLVVDAMAAGALSVAERLGRPSAVLVHLRYRFFTEERGATSWAALFDMVNDHRAAIGLPSLTESVGFLAELWERVGPVFVTGPGDLEGPGRPIPSHVSHVPVFDPSPGVLPTEVAKAVVPDGRPLVVVSLSSTYMHQEALLASVLDAVSLLDVRVVVTLGQGMSPEMMSGRDDAVFAPWVPHEVLLEHADVVVSHAGYGTVLAAIRAGVPLVCLPMARDQPGNAAQVAALGAGVMLDADASAVTIRDALEQVLRDGRHLDCARRLSTELARLGVGDSVVASVEALVASRTP